MRIGPINAGFINAIASPSAVAAVKPSSIDHALERLANDTASLNQVRALVAEAMKQPEIRTDKVQAIKSQIANSAYDLNATKITDALVSSDEI